MLETITNPNKVNIKDLVLEEPLPPLVNNLPFDPERDITQEDWKAITDNLNDFSHTLNPLDQLLGLHTIQMLFPNRMREFQVDFETISEAGIVSVVPLRQNLDFAKARTAMRFLAYTSIAFPEKRPEVRTVAENFKEVALNDLDNINDPLYCDEYFNYALVFPQEVLPIIRSKEEIKNVLSSEVDHRRIGLAESTAWLFAIVLAQFKLLSPDREVKISEGEWNLMKEGLDYFRSRKEWFNFASAAWGMKVLAAEQATMNENGELELVMSQPKQPFAEAVPSLPSVRKF